MQAERVRDALQNIQIAAEDFTITLTASFGAAGTEQGVIGKQSIAEVGLEQLIHFADKALYLAKNSGKNRVCALTDASAPSA